MERSSEILYLNFENPLAMSLKSINQLSLNAKGAQFSRPFSLYSS
ncbi:unnamed protein product [Moneuplotes crassus]|uniref:Uncharacterized protein n=1 Tax=Euplotes crassus TaxID=5936 RepID=A0AAD1Y1V7_EUPCR|nr:unnamed protein product [Moneuplotes crassus]